MFRDLCSCHKNKKNADEDDLPYSPKKDTVFFGFRKNTVINKTFTSTPNQLVQVRKIEEDELINHKNMDAKNNNQLSAKNETSIRDQNNFINSTNSRINFIKTNPKDEDLTSSPIEINSSRRINLDSDDKLNDGPSMNRTSSSFRQENQQIGELNDEFSNLWSNDHQYLNENSSNEKFLNSKIEPFDKLVENSSTGDSLNKFTRCDSANLLSASSFDSDFKLTKSDNDLFNLKLNNQEPRCLIKNSKKNSVDDSTDFMFEDDEFNNKINNQSNRPSNKRNSNSLTFNDVYNILKIDPTNSDLKDDNLIIKETNQPNKSISPANENLKNLVKNDLFNNAQTNNNLTNDGSINNDVIKEENQIKNFINIPKDPSGLLKRVSEDKLSLDSTSIESVVLDKKTNELVRRDHLNQNETDDSINKHHPNSIIIKESLTLTLKRDKNDKKSLNEFSIENMIPRQSFEKSSYLREYFYDEPIIKTSSKFYESDLTIYRMKSDPRGLCLIINNATMVKECLRLKNGFTKEVNYAKDLFSKLGFDVEIYNNVKAADICKLMKKIKDGTEFEKHDAFICLYFGHGNQNYVIGEDNFKLNLELMIGCMNNYHCPKLINKPKIFIVHTCNSKCQTFLEPIPPCNIPREIQALKRISEFKIIPTWTDTIIIYSPFLDVNLSFSPFIKEFGKSLCLNAWDLSLHDILLETNNELSKKAHYNDQYGVDITYRGFNKSLYFNPGHFRKIPIIQTT